MLKPVMYLDVDGVLWDIQKDLPAIIPDDPRVFAKGVVGLEKFLEFAFKHFEVRWCTTWARSGHMDMRTKERLRDHTGIPVSTWSQIRDSCGWDDFKYENISIEEHLSGRPFVWVEDGLLDEEIGWLIKHEWLHNYFYTDVFENSQALVKTTEQIREWLRSQ